MWTKYFAWFWGTYGVMHEHGLVRPCRFEGASLIEIFQGVAQHDRTELLMSLYKARRVEVHERIRFRRTSLIRPPLNSSRTSKFNSTYLNILIWLTVHRWTSSAPFWQP